MAKPKKKVISSLKLPTPRLELRWHCPSGMWHERTCAYNLVLPFFNLGTLFFGKCHLPIFRCSCKTVMSNQTVAEIKYY
jgi:hypothetical protein